MDARIHISQSQEKSTRFLSALRGARVPSDPVATPVGCLRTKAEGSAYYAHPLQVLCSHWSSSTSIQKRLWPLLLEFAGNLSGANAVARQRSNTARDPEEVHRRRSSPRFTRSAVTWKFQARLDDYPLE